MGTIKELYDFVKKHGNDEVVTAEVMKEFLTKLKSVYEDFLQRKITDIEVSDATIYWCSTEEKFSDNLEKVEPRISGLNEAMDITHPDFSEDKKRKIISRMLGLVEELMS